MRYSVVVVSSLLKPCPHLRLQSPKTATIIASVDRA